MPLRAALAPTSALNSSIRRSHAGMLSTRPLPEALLRAAVEVLERYALLLDPGVVAEIENALAIEMGELEHMIVDDAFEMPAEDLAGIDTSSNPSG